MGRDRSVSIATSYGMDRPGIESRWDRDFPHPSRPALGPTQPLIQRVPGLSQGVKRPGRRVNQPPPSSAEVKERAQLNLRSPFGPSGPLLWWTSPYLVYLKKTANFALCDTRCLIFITKFASVYCKFASVYCAVRTGALNRTVYVSSSKS